METFFASMVGAFLAAWAGAMLAFRRTKKERALDHRISWHERTIRALADYEGQLERLHRESRNAVITSMNLAPPDPSETEERRRGSIPKHFKPRAQTWEKFAEVEEEVRGALRLADLYAEGRTRVECSVGLNNVTNLVAAHWVDLGPEPEIPWLDLQSRIQQTSRIRRYVEESLRLVLELDGFVATVLGPRYRKKKTLRELNRLREEIGSGAS